MRIEKFIQVLGVALAIVLTQEEAVAIANTVYAEANAETDKGKRLVVDCVLNRVEDDRFPDTVMGVLTQPNQFSKGKAAPDEFVQLVMEEAESRTDPRVLWFRTRRYHKWGRPIVKEGLHYFSGN